MSLTVSYKTVALLRETREQLVELLLCASDLGLRGYPSPLSLAAERTGLELIRDLADEVVEAMRAQCGTESGKTWPAFGADCLEAARLVEEGEWP